MKTTLSPRRHRAGILLVECIVYLAVFALILSGGLAAFYFCWDNSKALIGTTDDLAAALHAGEGWRADIRTATGPIERTAIRNGEDLVIPAGTNIISYRFVADTVTRATTASPGERLVLSHVKLSRMLADPRGDLRAWRWDLKLAPRRAQIKLPLEYTFAAVPAHP